MLFCCVIECCLHIQSSHCSAVIHMVSKEVPPLPFFWHLWCIPVYQTVRKCFPSPRWQLECARPPGYNSINIDLWITVLTFYPVPRDFVFTVVMREASLCQGRHKFPTSHSLPPPRELVVYLTISCEIVGTVKYHCCVRLQRANTQSQGASGSFRTIPEIGLFSSHHWAQCNLRG